MSTKHGKDKKLADKETILSEITVQLSQSLTSLKESLGEKKFDKRIRKAAKLLVAGIKSSTHEKIPAAKSAPKKSTKVTAKVVAPAKKVAKKTAPSR